MLKVHVFPGFTTSLAVIIEPLFKLPKKAAQLLLRASIS
jgi:hypothetical protein